LAGGGFQSGIADAQQHTSPSNARLVFSIKPSVHDVKTKVVLQTTGVSRAALGVDFPALHL